MTRDELKRRRAALGMTQADLAGELGVKTPTVAQWEWGRRPMPGAWLDLALKALTCREHAEERPV